MTTKEQERKALERIRKIVADLGEDSYVGTAFTGCFDDAETNIENDWGCSPYDRWQSAEREVEKLRKDLELANRNNDDLRKRAEGAERLYNQEQGIADSLRARFHDAEDMATKNWNAFRDQEDRADALEQEIIHLKAKLYDLMTAGA